ncbi:MAG TPA: SRPBCC family protein [Acidimicrobiia bacterium]
MAAITVSIGIDAPPDRVWSELADLSSHVSWMEDAVAISFLTVGRQGLSTRMAVATRFGPFRMTDVMEVTGWEPPRRLAVRHEGLVTGSGEFLLSGALTTTLLWREQLRFPWYWGGRLTSRAAAPFLRRVWRRNLARLKSKVED